MRLILLPAFDGTGLMFDEFVNELGNAFSVTAISYPESGPQDYQTLSDYVRQHIPKDQPYLVLGESFAGPIVYQIAVNDSKNCKAAIFVATYLTNPSPVILKKLTMMPAAMISFLVSRPLIVRKSALSPAADSQVAKAIANNFASVDAEVIKKRLMTINSVGDAPEQALDIPCLCVNATQDKLVMENKHSDFEKLCPSLERKMVEGGHFILQENPKQSAQVVLQAFNHLFR